MRAAARASRGIDRYYILAVASFIKFTSSHNLLHRRFRVWAELACVNTFMVPADVSVPAATDLFLYPTSTSLQKTWSCLKNIHARRANGIAQPSGCMHADNQNPI